MIYFVYLLQSVKDGSFYVGFTTDLQRRLKEHNSGHSNYSSKHGPWKLIYFEEFKTLEEAVARERYLKTGAGRKFRKKLIESGGTREISL